MNTVLVERVLPTAQTIQIVQGDLAAETTDAIVNAANEHLQHGAGVAGAIVHRGGQKIQHESDAWIRLHGPVSHARPAWTSGGLLPARYVIHAVGPVWGSGMEDSKLSSAIHGALQVADELKLASISFPAVSTGIYGFPKERAARLIFSAIQSYFLRNESGIKLVRVVLFDEPTTRAFVAAWAAPSGP
jgi:O-acetyl-ADP-ribose deacetylase (regulator of RNase III)